MNQQTEQLLLHFDDAPKQESVDSPAMPQYIGEAKERLRLLDDLKRHKGYQLLVEALNGEARLCLHAMDKAETPTAITKTSANYYTLTQAVGWVDNEMLKLRAFLKSVSSVD